MAQVPTSAVMRVCVCVCVCVSAVCVCVSHLMIVVSGAVSHQSSYGDLCSHCTTTGLENNTPVSICDSSQVWREGALCRCKSGM